MSVPQKHGSKRPFRHRIREIKLEPQTSTYDIRIELHKDGIKAHELPPIKKGKPLLWKDLFVPCDVVEGSMITVKVTEVHKLQNRVGRVGYSVVLDAGPGVLSIRSEDNDEQMFQAYIAVFDRQTAEQAYLKALQTAKSLDKRQGPIERAGKIGDAAKMLLDLGGILAELDPTGGAKVAVSACTMAWERLQVPGKQDVKLDKLIENMAGVAPVIDKVRGIANIELKETVLEMLRLIEDASAFILSSRSSSWSGRALRSVLSSAPDERIDALVERFAQLREQFRERMQVQNLQDVVINEHRERLKELEPVGKTSYNPSRKCLDGTRVRIIEDITTWARSDIDGPQFAWVHGLAGLGKSSIATSVCKQLDEQGALACAFFCKRDSPELRDPRRVLMALSCGLAKRWDAYRLAVVTAIRDNTDLHSKYLQPLYDTLLGKPLRELEDTEGLSKCAIVVDALDECGDVTTRKQLLACLQEISNISGLKVAVTSRPDEDILTYFRNSSRDWFTEFDVVQYDAADDIRIYVQNTLGGVTAVKGWPKDAIEQLSVRANGLFIWARTSCTYILGGLDRCQRLRLVLSGTHLADIDALYTAILTANESSDGQDNMEHLRRCLGAIVATAMHSPLSVDTLATLMDGHISQPVLELVVGRLSSVLYTSQDLGAVIRISHPSFMDYITTPARSKDLCVDLEMQHTILADCCLKTMSGGLSFNMCALDTSDKLNVDIIGLDMKVKEAIAPHLLYSCVYWASHLTHDSGGDCKLILRSFLRGPELLYWLEALSLLNKLNVAPTNLLHAVKFCTLNSMQDLRTIANDAYRFVLAFYDPISTSTPHLYVSALAFAPLGSDISRRMRAAFTNMLIATDNEDEEWTPCIRTISVGSDVHSVAISPDGQLVASGSSAGEVQTWDVETGEAVLAPFKGHTGTVESTTFSHDGRLIVSGSSDQTIRVWDTETGDSVFAPLLGHSGLVLSVACSLDGKLLASGSEDETIRIWNARNSEPTLEPLRGHAGDVLSVAFSPDSCYVVSGSQDKTVRLWDAKTGDAMLKPLRGHSDWVRCVAFSPDCQRVISGSDDCTVRIWSSERGDELSELKGHSSWVMSVAFSPDGGHIASSSNDRTVLVWDAKTGTLVLGSLHGHSGPVSSVTFSPGGDRIISGAQDGTIRIWDAAASLSIRALVSSSTVPQVDLSAIYSVAISSDGRQVVSGSASSNVCIWDVDTGEPVLQPLEGHSGEVLSVAFSPDDSLVASGSQDSTVRIWNAKSGEQVRGPIQGHSDTVNAVTFSPNGSFLAACSDDKTVRIWSVETGDSASKPLTGHSDWVSSVAFSPDSRRIVSGSADNTVRVWDVETGNTVLGPLEGHSDRVTCVAYSPDGHLVASGSWDYTIRIWNAQTGHAMLSPLRDGSAWVLSIAFSPDSRRIISGSDDGRLRVWDTETGAMVHQPLQGHTHFVNSVAVSSDGRRIYSGSSDGTARIWDGERYLGLTSDSQDWVLPDTQVRLQSPAAESAKLLVSSGELACWLDPERPGWVTTLDGRPLLWLPHELRQADSSIMCIPKWESRKRVIDFTHFAHGKSWTSIKKA